MNDLIIIPKPDSISWQEITELLHLGYAERANEGLKFSAVDQSVEKTIERIKDGVCMVALFDGQLTGTESYHLIERKKLKWKRWYHDDRFYYFHSFTVHPDYKKKGIGLKLKNSIREEAIKNNINALICDTSIHAKWLIDWYSRLGFQKVGYVSHVSTNYYSVVMRTPISGKQYSTIYCSIRYWLSILFCKCTFKENGQLRLLGNIGKKIYFNYFLKS
ncbi:MAG TPA: GNAT family N-acetyltransferase [Prolixibacteraceae bacterium]|nr:GNAT family N-acetyltransferase [Prolixibacteraceae bacterium]